MQKTIVKLFTWTLLLLLTVALTIGCGEMKGEKTPNKQPTVSFITVPVDSAEFDYAPKVYWRGSDPDGFVDHYSFADIVDQEAVADPQAFIPSIPNEAWKDTIATEATVYLLTESGDRSEHIFYIRSTDNENIESNVKYRTFFRTNRAPNIPIIGTTGADEDDWGTRYVVADTLVSSPKVTDIYAGIQFSWKGNDPDDKVLRKIPLEYQQVLVKAPNDTIFVGEWTNKKNTTLIDLATGFYTLHVWSRDDGMTLSPASARAEFNVIRPAFRKKILFVNLYGEEQANYRLPYEFTESGPAFKPFPAKDRVRGFYEDVFANLTSSNVSIDATDPNDVTFWEIGDPTDADQVPPLETISQYSMVILALDQLGMNSNANGDVETLWEDRLSDYLQVGGRVWIQGRGLSGNFFKAPDAGIAANAFLENFFGIRQLEELTVTDQGARFLSRDGYVLKALAEFIGTDNAIEEHPSFALDEASLAENIAEEFYSYDNEGNVLMTFAGFVPGNYGIPGVCAISRTNAARTIQYFKSYSAGQTPVVNNEDAEVVSEVGDLDYPATANACYLKVSREKVQEVTRVINTSRTEDQNRVGEVVVINNNYIFVTYDEGQPWSEEDVLEVDYSYDAITDAHLKPVSVRNEHTEQIDFLTEIRYRTAFTGFSYYFMEREDVYKEWSLMLDWFMNPNPNRNED